MFDALTLILRAYTRAFVSQGVGIIGLGWCLAEGQAGLATVLTILVLADQAIFLRGRLAPETPPVPHKRLLNGWCFAVSGIDILICLAAIMSSAGLRAVTGGDVTSSPLDCLAYVLATFAHGSTGLVPITPAGRLLSAAMSALGGIAFLIALFAVALRFRQRD